jgi:hypothetical protein
MKPCRHTDSVQTCRVCELYATRADYRRLWDGTPNTKRGLCMYVGDKLSGPRQVPCQCRYECEAGEPFAMPAGVCQSCPKWESER